MEKGKNHTYAERKMSKRQQILWENVFSDFCLNDDKIFYHF